MPDLTRSIILVVLLLFSAFFSMSESAFSYCNVIKLRVKAEQGSKSASLVLKHQNKFDRYIINVLICNNIVNILFSVVATTMFVEISPEYGVVLTTVFSTLLVLTFGEVIPKTIAKSRPDEISQVMIYPMSFLIAILTPIIFVFESLINGVKKAFKVGKSESLLSEQDFQDVIESIEEQEQITPEESEIIQSAVEFSDMKVKQVMTKKEEIVALDVDKEMNKEEMIDFLAAINFSRIPVYKESIDNIVGILHVRTALKSLMLDKYQGVEKQMAEPLKVKPNVHLDTIFEEFKKHKTHIAIVTDKEGITLGMVTMEDVLEELVGDIDKDGDSNE